MKIKNIAFLFVLGLLVASNSFAQLPSLSAKDLGPLSGDLWTGTLTYVDYGSGKRTSIKSNILFGASTDRNTWTAEYLYPDEPKANSKATISLSSDGRVFNEQRVADVTRSQDGTLKFVTEKEGTDNGKKALFRYTYTLSTKIFSIRKDVKVEGSTEYFERNTYSWSR